jgi:hypothetical protein
MSGNERRGSRRVTFFCEAFLEGIDVGRTQVRLADLSVDGAFVDARTVLPGGVKARLRFTLSGHEIDTRVEIQYNIPGMGMGVLFLDLSPDDRAIIESFVAGQ